MAKAVTTVTLQVVAANAAEDAYAMVRDKVTDDARTWKWADGRTKHRIKHSRYGGFIDLSVADGVLLARLDPPHPADLERLVGSFIGRLVAWFDEDLTAINVQLRNAPAARARKAPPKGEARRARTRAIR